MLPPSIQRTAVEIMDSKLGLVVTAAEYIADVNPAHPFIRPVNPGLGPYIPAAATQRQIAQLNHQYTNAKDEYPLVNTVEKALRKQITDSVDDHYLSSMHNHLTGMLTCHMDLLSLMRKSGKVLVTLFPRSAPPWPAKLWRRVFDAIKIATSLVVCFLQR
jgi:hypothetical protein